ncbi:helix-turn-helix domain-containing protein [Serinicoccus sp. LYQ131]|uniref:helix-turn-helix domain-containing protein n=1 Tax=Serinicoccus sp. LYQ131 TaxID=3378797 RepID=UPI00385185F1
MDGEALKRRRRALGWTQRILGDAAGVSTSTISRFESNYNHQPSQRTVERLREALENAEVAAQWGTREVRDRLSRLSLGPKALDPTARLMKSTNALDPTARLMKSTNALDPTARLMKSTNALDPTARLMKSINALDSTTQAAALINAIDPTARLMKSINALDSTTQAAALINAIDPTARLMKSINALDSTTQAAALINAIDPTARLMKSINALDSTTQAAALINAIDPTKSAIAKFVAFDHASQILEDPEETSPWEALQAIFALSRPDLREDPEAVNLATSLAALVVFTMGATVLVVAPDLFGLLAGLIGAGQGATWVKDKTTGLLLPKTDDH